MTEKKEVKSAPKAAKKAPAKKALRRFILALVGSLRRAKLKVKTTKLLLHN